MGAIYRLATNTYTPAAIERTNTSFKTSSWATPYDYVVFGW